MAISGAVAAVYVSDVNAAPVTFTDEATTPDAEHKRYQVTNPVYRYWDPATPVVVKKNGVVITTGFTLEPVGGFVVFSVALLETDVITVSGKALTLVQAGGMFNWSLDTDQETQDKTTFASGGWKEFDATLIGWSGSAEAYWGDERFFKSLGNIVVVKLYLDSGPSQRCLEGYALIKGDGIEGPVNSLVQENIDFTGTGALYPRNF